MKMIMTVVTKKVSEKLLTALINAGFMATYGETRGGMLHQSQMTIYIAVDADRVESVLDVIRQNCKSRSQIQNISSDAGGQSVTEVSDFEQGEATTFIWDLERLVKE